VVKSRLYTGLADVLDRIAPERRFAILSNKPHELTVAVADALLRRWRFEPTLGARRDHPHKPDPRAVLPIAAELGVTPDACRHPRRARRAVRGRSQGERVTRRRGSGMIAGPWWDADRAPSGAPTAS
jgi:hypothetical protein